MEKLKQIPYNGYKINIYQDDDYESPQNDVEYGFLVFDHRQFCVEKEGFVPHEIFENNGKVPGYFVFKCCAYIHSGVSVSVGRDESWPDQRWDVSCKGYWIIKRQKGTYTVDRAQAVAESLCKEWNQYLSGDVYGYMIEDENGDEEGGCWGYWGEPEDSYLINEAKNEIDELINKKQTK